MWQSEAERHGHGNKSWAAEEAGYQNMVKQAEKGGGGKPVHRDGKLGATHCLLRENCSDVTGHMPNSDWNVAVLLELRPSQSFTIPALHAEPNIAPSSVYRTYARCVQRISKMLRHHPTLTRALHNARRQHLRI